MRKFKMMMAPEEALELVYQKYDAGWAQENLARVTTINNTAFVCMEPDHPEAFMFYLRLREESLRIAAIAAQVIQDGMPEPVGFNQWGLLTEWDTEGPAVKKINLDGYLAD